MRFLIVGADKDSGEERNVIIEAGDEKTALRIAKSEGVFPYRVEKAVFVETTESVVPPPVIQDAAKLVAKEQKKFRNQEPYTSQQLLTRIFFGLVGVLIVVGCAVLLVRGRSQQSAAEPIKRAESSSQASEIKEIDADDEVMRSILDQEATQLAEQTYSEKLLDAIRHDKEVGLGPSLTFLPLPPQQSTIVKVFQQYAKFRAIDNPNELQQIELEKLVNQLGQKLTQRVQLERWLIEVTEIYVNQDGSIGLEARIGALFFHRCDFRCDDPRVIADLRELDLPAVIEIDGVFTGRFDDLGELDTGDSPLTLNLGEQDVEIDVGHLLVLYFELKSVRTLYDDAGEAVLKERINQEKANVSLNGSNQGHHGSTN